MFVEWNKREKYNNDNFYFNKSHSFFSLIEFCKCQFCENLRDLRVKTSIKLPGRYAISRNKIEFSPLMILCFL